MTRKKKIQSVVALLRGGGVILYPTETSYALGCDATNARAVKKIFRIKGRQKGKPLPLIVASRRMAERYARFGPLEKKLAKKYWPGALTIVAGYREQGIGYSERMQKTLNPKPYTLAPRVIADDGTIAVRVSSHPVARALSRALGRPIVATSANKSGDPAAYSVADALRSLGIFPSPQPSPSKGRGSFHSPNPSPAGRGGLIDAVIDVGRLPKRKASTIVRVANGVVEVLRKGALDIRSVKRKTKSAK